MQTLLLNGVWEKPPGYVPRVHKVTDAAELDKRALEATRLGPALSEASWEKMLGEPAAALERDGLVGVEEGDGRGHEGLQWRRVAESA